MFEVQRTLPSKIICIFMMVKTTSQLCLCLDWFYRIFQACHKPQIIKYKMYFLTLPKVGEWVLISKYGRYAKGNTQRRGFSIELGHAQVCLCCSQRQEVESIQKTKKWWPMAPAQTGRWSFLSFQCYGGLVTATCGSLGKMCWCSYDS